MSSLTSREVIDALSPHVLTARYERLKTAVRERTRWITVAFDQISHQHNQSAVLRTCECLGIQDVHICTEQGFQPSRDVVQGAASWLTIEESPSVGKMLGKLRARGYQLIATTPHREGTVLPVNRFDPCQGPVALLFGEESQGLSEKSMAAADAAIYLPMVGLTESLNLSVAAALLLQVLLLKLQKRGTPYQLSAREQEEVLAEWLQRSVKSSNLILERYALEKGKRG